MTKTRREVLEMTAWAAALPLLSVTSPALLAAGPAPVDISRLQASAGDFFVKLGYRQLAAMHLITGADFNDGLRYDDTPELWDSGKTFRIQDCGRIEDLPKKGEPGVLPYFHIFALSIEKPAFRGELLTQVLDYLVTRAKLDPARLALVSTDNFKPYLIHLKPFGVSAGQFVQRERTAAMAAGDGSGYFHPAGHPQAPAMHTVSIHYSLEEVSGELQYPLPGFIELAEVGIDADNAELLERESGGFGMERLLMAQGKAIDSFPVGQQKALEALKAEAVRRGVELPEAYKKISKA